jgi:hypothetical protein
MFRRGICAFCALFNHMVLRDVWCSVGGVAYAAQRGILNRLLAGFNSAVTRGHTSNTEYHNTHDDASDDDYEVKNDLDENNGRGTSRGKTSRSRERKAVPGKRAKPSGLYERLRGLSQAQSGKSRGNRRKSELSVASSDEGSELSASGSGDDSVESGSGSHYSTTDGRKTTQTGTKGASKSLKTGSDSRQSHSKARATSRQPGRRAGSVAEGLMMRNVKGTLMARGPERKRYSTASGRASKTEEQIGLDVAVVEVQEQSDCGLVR